ncbi:hypothetical protein CANARDRAFT_27817 [[Candida] arabinofermentans NRRL YB-2248]|uniref:Uncharacterized protein n=1 Tax=[Candida] arabinofermentans NRRL YB-2248 TaxID=983967 RepID=A0A1E4T1Z8_9ASCO|nr:hypothetical protein CANARDRAFT_27817 [[Candida] arabinofermentans NRRL YB-2248]
MLGHTNILLSCTKSANFNVFSPGRLHSVALRPSQITGFDSDPTLFSTISNGLLVSNHYSDYTHSLTRYSNLLIFAW